MSSSIAPIGDLYIQKQNEMDTKFQNVIIMMEIGKFYEVYTFETEHGEVGRAKEMSRICNIVLTRKNKNNAPSLSNPYMCGFPSHSLTRYIQHLVSHGYTVAVYDQNTTVHNKIERVLQGVYSPSVMIGEMDDLEDVDRCLLTVAVENSCFFNNKQKEVFSVAHVCINTTNGEISCGEETFYHEQEMVSYVLKLQEIYHPQEILARECPELDKAMVHPLPIWEKENRKYKELSFQQIVLEKVFPNRSSQAISIFEDLQLERHPDLLSILVYTICFLEEHHPLSIYRLQKPVFLQHTDNMMYNTQCLYDLNLFDLQEKNNSLFNILDQTCTPAGKRLLRKTMFAPHYNMIELKKSYDEISTLIPLVDNIQFKKNVPFYNIDAEHTLRKIQIGNVSPPVVYRFVRLLTDFDQFMIKLPSNLVIVEQWKKQESIIGNLRSFLSTVWDMALLQAWRTWETDGVWKQTPFILIEKQSKLDKKEHEFRKWMDTHIGRDMFSRLVFTDEEAYLNTTKKMYQELKHRHDLQFKKMSSGYRVSHDQIDRYFRERKALLTFLIKTRRRIFLEQVQQLTERHNEIIIFMTKTISYIDMMMSHAINARRFRLERPEPTTTPNTLSCKNLRHLIVEVMNPEINYVANDVKLTDHHGILLFGQNSAGKCFEYNTQMVLWNGQQKAVQDLVLEDLLIGDDGTPRRILALTKGKGPLYDVIREDTKDVLMTINEEHIMCLTDKTGSKFLEVPLKHILKKPFKYSGMMNQYTRCVGAMCSKETRQEIIKRQYYMNDDEWIKIYLSFLHCGRRIHFSHNCLVIESSSHNIVPISIRSKTKHGQFFGFGLDGNEHFLLPDGNVCHNSTLMKSLGVSIMMAQCGMYVPCSSMTWTPITSLFTKIISRDNIWKGKSTFITEMNELKHILYQSNNTSLVLCDELTSGTETFSAAGIVATTLETLLERKSKFIITTHLHSLQQFSSLMAHSELRVMHFGMEYKDKQLIFDRILREGSGKSTYGLEIAEFLGFPPEFIQKAFQYRSQLDANAVPLQPQGQSRYNKNIWMDACEKCGSRDNLHTHHILPQKDASVDQYIGLYHKNKSSNLQVLCQKCHQELHHGH